MSKVYPKRDVFIRLAYLNQASHLIMNQVISEKKQMDEPAKNINSLVNVLEFYGKCFSDISKRNVLKIHPNIKRSSCKKCKMLLIPGITARFRIKSKKCTEKKVVVSCTNCRFKKAYLINDFHTLWLDHHLSLAPYENIPFKSKKDFKIKKLKTPNNKVVKDKNNVTT